MQAFIEAYNFIYNNDFFPKDSVSLLYAYMLLSSLSQWGFLKFRSPPSRSLENTFPALFLCLHKVRSTAEKMKFSIKDLSSS